MAIEVSDLTGFQEESLERAFEQPARLTFTLQGVRSDDAPLDTDVEYVYTVNGVALITGYLRVLEESLGSDDDYQRYTLTDRWQDITREALIVNNTARFTLNPDNAFADDGTSPQDTLGKLIEYLADQSVILSGSPKVSWPASAPLDPVERNIEVEGRGIGEMIVELLRYNPSFRLYYNSLTNQLTFKDLMTPTIKTVKLNRLHTSWEDRPGAPPFSDVCQIELTSDKTDCYENIRLEGFGVFRQVTNTLVPAWDCGISPPYFPQDFIENECMSDDFARKFRLPDGSVPAAFSFDEEGRAKEGQTITLEAYVPKRNTGQCVTADDDPSVGIYMEADCYENRWETGSGNEWQWTDFRWLNVGEVEVPVPDIDGQYIIRTQDRMLSSLNVWSPNAWEFNMGGGPMLPDDPRILAWEMRATYWEKVSDLIIEMSGGCPNGTTYQRVNRDWVKVTRVDPETGLVVSIRDDTAAMENMRDKLFDQVARPKTSGTITIYLHLVSPTAVLEGPIKTSPYGGVNVGNPGALWELGDALNIVYDPSETLGPGILPDYGGPGVDVTWENLDISVMGISYDRRGQTLTLQVANTPFIFGDRMSEGLQR